MNIKDFFKNENGEVNYDEFYEAIKDASLMQKLKKSTKFIVILEDLEKQLKKKLNVKKNVDNDILLANYKRYLSKHILEIEKTNEG